MSFTHNPAPSSPDLDDTNGTQATAQLLSLAEFDRSVTKAPLVLPSLGSSAAQPSNPLHHVRATLTVRIGSAEVTVGELLNAKEHQVIRLEQLVEGPVDILLEGQVIARGTLVAVEDHFGVRITEVPRPLLP